MQALARLVSLAPLALAAATVLAPPVEAQKPKPPREWHEDALHGYRFKFLDGWAKVPPQPMEARAGLVLRMSGPDFMERAKGGRMTETPSEMVVLRIADVEKEPVAVAAGDSGRTVASKLERPELEKVLPRMLKRFKLLGKPYVDEEKSLGRNSARNRVWKASYPAYGGVDGVVDAWSFRTDHADFHLVWAVPGEDPSRWQKFFERSARTFEEIPIEELGRSPEDGSYGDAVEWYEKKEAIYGWRVVPTPSEKYIVLTASDNSKFVGEVIARLESSRELYERDYPPPDDFDHVSVVRVCKDQEQFHQYGGTGGGVVGWFNSATTELVLYDAVNVDRNMSYSVMSHEAFHQYCHFLFGQSEAHRWFDEGHGDYYGGVDFKYGRAKITTRMPSGLERLSHIKEMVREGTYAPIEEHVNYDRDQWHGQGPSNVSCYAQSWSLVYFLRQGMLGNVPSKVWKEEYADILPSYIDTLSAAYQEAYAEILGEREEKAEARGRELTPKEKEINRFSLPPDKKDEIWEKAIDAAWGDIDMARFEDDWKAFVADHL